MGEIGLAWGGWGEVDQVPPTQVVFSTKPVRPMTHCQNTGQDNYSSNRSQQFTEYLLSFHKQLNTMNRWSNKLLS